MPVLKNTKHSEQMDEQIGAICRWLKENHCTMHVTLNGSVTVRKKTQPKI